MTNSVDPDQTAPIGAVCSGSTLLASILNSSVMQGNFLQQTTSADDIFRYIFLLALYWLNKDKNFFINTEQTGSNGNIYYMYFQIQRDITPKIGNPELWFLHSACLLMMVNILSYRTDTFKSKNLQNSVSKGLNS